MSVRRTWAVFDVYLGTPVLVERCNTKAGALRVAEQRGCRTCGSLVVIEQLLPAAPRLLHADDTIEPAQ